MFTYGIQRYLCHPTDSSVSEFDIHETLRQNNLLYQIRTIFTQELNQICERTNTLFHLEHFSFNFGFYESADFIVFI